MRSSSFLRFICNIRFMLSKIIIDYTYAIRQTKRIFIFYLHLMNKDERKTAFNYKTLDKFVRLLFEYFKIARGIEVHHKSTGAFRLSIIVKSAG